MISSISHAKVQSAHLRRQAVVYVRQSSAHQVRGCRESGQRQYALVERARSLGWPTESVQTIDDDQGRSGAGATHREGFKRLLAEIGAGQVGVVLALEASRLARSSADWHRLVEICVVTQTLLADETAVYDPRDPNDRLLLGVKGTISEAELFTLRCRLHEGRWNKARRGDLRSAVFTVHQSCLGSPFLQFLGHHRVIFRHRLGKALNVLVLGVLGGELTEGGFFLVA
jgi:DNA invertase Pin-like site-specific DNA recombinase